MLWNQTCLNSLSRWNLLPIERWPFVEIQNGKEELIFDRLIWNQLIKYQFSFSFCMSEKRLFIKTNYIFDIQK